MNATRLLVLSAVLLCWAAKAPAEVDLPAAAKEVLKQFEQEGLEVEKKIEAEVKARKEKTIVELKKVQDAFCKEAKLDEALAVRELSRAIQAGTNGAAAADLPAAAKEIYKQHEEEVAEIIKKTDGELKKRQDKVIAELKKVQDAFCKEAKLEEAIAVRDLIRMVKDGVANALPDPGYINNGELGKVSYYEVTGVATGQSIYGTDTYTTGSHLGMAAVHCGLLKVGQKGVVKVTMTPGQNDYPATTRHGVTSYAYTAWGSSFKVERVYSFIGKVSLNAVPDPGTLTGIKPEAGKPLLFEVTGTDAGSVWGQDIYTDDSTLAAAAVHAGVLAIGQKGIVKVTLLPGQESYPSTTRNGVTSGAWGSWTGSFRVEAAK